MFELSGFRLSGTFLYDNKRFKGIAKCFESNVRVIGSALKMLKMQFKTLIKDWYINVHVRLAINNFHTTISKIPYAGPPTTGEAW